VMTLRSHSRGGRSSACAPEPSRQAGSYSTENSGVHPTRPQKFGPEPEIRSSHINYPTDPTPGGTSPHSSPPENNSADNVPYQLQVPTGSQPNSTVPTEPSQNEQVSTEPHLVQWGTVSGVHERSFHWFPHRVRFSRWF